MDRLKIFVSKYAGSKFAKGVLFISGGTAIAQILNTLFSMVITRIYTPEEYGILTVYTSVLLIVSTAGALKYEWGIPISDDDESAANVLVLSFLVLALISGAIFLFMIFKGEWFLNLFDAGQIIDYRYLIPIGVLFTGAYNIFNQWAYRKKSFKDVSKTKISQSIVQNIMKVSLGLLHFGPLGLIFGRIAGQSAGITTLSRPFFRMFKGKEISFKETINLKRIKKAAVRYKNFPIFSAPGQVLNIAGLQLPVLFITSIYGSAVVGVYGLANAIINLPMNLISQSVGDVFYSEAASIAYKDPEKLRNLSNKLLKKLMIIGIIPVMGLVLGGPFLFSFFFGSPWYEAGVYARIIAFMMYARFIFNPINRIYIVFEKQKESLIFDIVRVAFIVTVFLSARRFEISSFNAILIYSFGMIVIYISTYLGSRLILRSAINRIKKT